MRYYKTIEHTNTTDKEEVVLQMTSSEEEKYKIIALHIVKETNNGILRLYKERDNFGTLLTGYATIQNTLTIPIDIELEVGKTFKITLQNKASGTNAGIVGFIEYEIVS
jgi:hypothetical protein